MGQGADRHLGTGYLYSTGTGEGQAPGNWVSPLVLFSLSRKEGERHKHRQIKLNAETIKWMHDPVEGTIKEEANGNLGWGEHPLAAEKDRAGRGRRERERGEEKGREELCRRRTWRRRRAEWRRTREALRTSGGLSAPRLLRALVAGAFTGFSLFSSNFNGATASSPRKGKERLSFSHQC